MIINPSRVFFWENIIKQATIYIILLELADLLRGNSGSPGPKGETGQAGSPGSPGAPGSPGLKGDPGLPGSVGPAGPRGQQGLPGVKGQHGQQGHPGAQGQQGRPGSKGEAGAPAPGYIWSMFSAFNRSLFPSKLFSCPLSPIFGKHLISFVLKEMPRGFQDLCQDRPYRRANWTNFCLHIQQKSNKIQ